MRDEVKSPKSDLYSIWVANVPLAAMCLHDVTAALHWMCLRRMEYDSSQSQDRHDIKSGLQFSTVSLSSY